MPAPSDTELGRLLLRLARSAIEAHLGADGRAPGADGMSEAGGEDGAASALARFGLMDGVAPGFAGQLEGADCIQVDPRLAERGATFVTLLSGGALRGCIGSLRAQRPLAEDLVANAISAATCDPRFAPLDADELARVRIEVSLLSPPNFLTFSDEDDLLRQLRPGEDGLILFSGCRSATFLPQVWLQLPEPRAFLSALKQKAGLPPDRPAANLLAATYTVQKWAEEEPIGQPATAPRVEPEAAA